MNNDENLLNLDFLVVADTRLTESTEMLVDKFSNWRILKRFDADDGLEHMGLMLLGSSRSNKDHLIVDLSKKKWQKVQKQKNMVFAQLLSVKFVNNQDFGFVYIRETPTFSDVDKIFKDIRL